MPAASRRTEGVDRSWRPVAHDLAPPALQPGTAHVWRVPLDVPAYIRRSWPLLSPAETARALRFARAEDQDRFIIAHGMLRLILGAYGGEAPASLEFVAGEHGKPALAGMASRDRLEFNLSHSGEIALIAVARNQAVGVDVERWHANVPHLDLAERYFSPAERGELATLGSSVDRLVEGFFAAWSRKEAYLKASGFGIARGLHHFDVSLTPDQPARILSDRFDATAAARWVMHAITPAPGYSGALVAASPLDTLLLLDLRI